MSRGIVARCGQCGRQTALYAGWCPRCLVRARETLKAVSWPVGKFLMDRGVVKRGDNLFFGKELYEKLQEAASRPQEVPPQEGPVAPQENVVGPGSLDEPHREDSGGQGGPGPREDVGGVGETAAGRTEPDTAGGTA